LPPTLRRSFSQQHHLRNLASATTPLFFQPCISASYFPFSRHFEKRAVKMGKRKAPEELSENPNTQRERKRRLERSPERKKYELQKLADSVYISRQLEKLRATEEYQAAGDDRRKALEDGCQSAAIASRYVQNVVVKM
jgi:hypothetical protein